MPPPPPPLRRAVVIQDAFGERRESKEGERERGREGQVCVVVGSPGRAKEVVPVGLKKEEEESSIFLEVWQIHSGVISLIL